MTDCVESIRVNNSRLSNSIKRRSIEDSFVYYVLISLFCINFLGRGSVFCLVFGLFAVVKTKNFKLDICSLFCFIMFLVSCIASIFYSDIIEAIKCLNFFLMYIVGVSGYCNAVNKKKYITMVLFSIFAGYALYIVLTFFANLNTVPEYDGQRVIKNFWTGERISVTLVGLISSVVIGYSGYVLLCKKKYLLKAVAIVSLILVVLINSKTATRTPILLILIVIGGMFLIYLFNQNTYKALKILFFILIIAILAIFLISIDFLGVRRYIESTPVFNRFQNEGVKTSRAQIFQMHLSYFFDYMWGGGNIQEATGEMAHNFLQQGHDLYGIFATVSLVLITICVLRNICKLLIKRKKNEIDYLFISMYFAMLIQSLLEPIFSGYPCFYFSFLLIHGVATGYVNNGYRYGEG